MPLCLRLTAVLSLCLLLAACGGEATDTGGGGQSAGTPADEAAHDHDAPGPHGGAIAIVGDHAAHLEALHDDVLGQVTVYVLDTDDDLLTLDQPPVLNLVTDEGSAQVKPSAIGGAWVFEHDALLEHPEKARFRVALGGKTYTVDMPCSHDHAEEGHEGHDHAAGEHEGHGPHDGVVQTFADGLGHLELKLHDDKGDLELWLTKDEEGKSPYDLPLDARITVRFSDPARSVSLAVRNRDRNEDEDGNPTLRDGKTNYFIFPGDTGADATWLQGEDFVSRVRVTIEADGKTYVTQPFELRPHTHGAGEHDH